MNWWNKTKSQQTIIVVGGLVGTEIGAGEVVRNGQRPLGRRGWYGPSSLGRQLFGGEFYSFYYKSHLQLFWAVVLEYTNNYCTFSTGEGHAALSPQVDELTVWCLLAYAFPVPLALQRDSRSLFSSTERSHPSSKFEEVCLSPGGSLGITPLEKLTPRAVYTTAV